MIEKCLYEHMNSYSYVEEVLTHEKRGKNKKRQRDRADRIC